MNYITSAEIKNIFVMANIFRKLLRPKNTTFCAGCPGKLNINRTFEYEISIPEQKHESAKVINLKDTVKKKKGGKVKSLF